MGRRLCRQHGTGPFMEPTGFSFSTAFRRLEEIVQYYQSRNSITKYTLPLCLVPRTKPTFPHDALACRMPNCAHLYGWLSRVVWRRKWTLCRLHVAPIKRLISLTRCQVTVLLLSLRVKVFAQSPDLYDVSVFKNPFVFPRPAWYLMLPSLWEIYNYATPSQYPTDAQGVFGSPY